MNVSTVDFISNISYLKLEMSQGKEPDNILQKIVQISQQIKKIQNDSQICCFSPFKIKWLERTGLILGALGLIAAWGNAAITIAKIDDECDTSPILVSSLINAAAITVLIAAIIFADVIKEIRDLNSDLIHLKDIDFIFHNIHSILTDNELDKSRVLLFSRQLLITHSSIIPPETLNVWGNVIIKKIPESSNLINKFNTASSKAKQLWYILPKEESNSAFPNLSNQSHHRSNSATRIISNLKSNLGLKGKNSGKMKREKSSRRKIKITPDDFGSSSSEESESEMFSSQDIDPHVEKQTVLKKAEKNPNNKILEECDESEKEINTTEEDVQDEIEEYMSALTKLDKECREWFAFPIRIFQVKTDKGTIWFDIKGNISNKPLDPVSSAEEIEHS